MKLTTATLFVVTIGASFIFFLSPEARQKLVASDNLPKIGLIFDVGGLGDKSFNDSAFLGLQKIRKELASSGEYFDASYLEPSSSEDRESALRTFAARGYRLVIAVGFIFSSDVDVVAHDYPNVHFACVDYSQGQSRIATNIAALTFREEEGSYLVGGVAGLLSKTKTVSFIGGMVGPLIKKFESGYVAGVKASCPDCIVRIGYAGTTPDAYRDPAKGMALASTQISQGSDIIYHASGATGLGVFAAAKSARVSAIGVDVDQYDAMPGTVVTSMIKKVDVAVYEVIKSELRNQFVSGVKAFGLADGGVDYVHDGPHALISEEIKGYVEQMKSRVVAGLVKVPSE